MATDFKTIERLLQLAKKYKLTEFSLEEGKLKVHFKTSRGASGAIVTNPVGFVAERSTVSSIVESSSIQAPEKSAAPNESVDENRFHKVISPFVGTFYRAPSPEADSYVKEGQVIRKGDVLCIVEAMKLMNEIESEVSGRIVSCLAENGQPVEYGEPLFLVDPL